MSSSPSPTCNHDFVYHGALDFFRNKELVAVIDSWRCRRCGVLRLGKRGPEVLSSTEGMYPDIAEGKHWVVFLCLAGNDPLIEVYQLSAGEEAPHRCEHYPPESVMVLSDNFTLRVGVDGPQPRKHFAYRFDKIVKGYVEVGKTPPEVVTITRQD